MTEPKVKLSTDHFLRGLNGLRNQTLLCDVHLVAEGTNFPAHRVVLAAASPYFQAMFTGGFKENELNEITLNDMSSEGLKCVLDAIYTAKLSLSEENIYDILPVASLMQLNEIVQHCGGFLATKISAGNCLHHLSFAEKYDLQEAVDECTKFILEHFDAVSQSIEFARLSKEQLCSCLSDDHLKVRNGEIEVYRATLKWYEANCGADIGEDSCFLAELMEHVRFPLIPCEFLLDEVLTNSLISGNSQVTKMVTEALKFQNADNIFLQPLQEGKQFQPRGEQMLALVHSRVRHTGQQSLVVRETKLHIIDVIGHDNFENEFSEEVLPMTLYPYSLSLVAKGNYLFLFGVDAKYCRPIATRFDVRKNTWLDLKNPPYSPSLGMGATLLKDFAYLFGGEHITKEKLNSVETFNTINVSNLSTDASKYSIQTNSWSKLQNLPRALTDHAAASHGNYVFCAGGIVVDTNSTDKLYAFDIVGKIWLSKASMIHKRSSFCLEAVGLKLVACGGRNSPNVEIYDIADDQWTVIQDGVLEHYVCPATIELNENLYVIGGAGRDENGIGSKTTDYVSIVDVNEATIRRESEIPFGAAGHVCALLTVPDTAANENSN